jgi:hypothetical protein
MKGTPISGVAAISYDPDTTAYIAAGKSNGGTLSSSVAGYFDTFIRGLKADSVWSKITDIGILAGWNNIAGAFTPLKTSAGITALNNTGFTDADYIATGADCGINYYRTLRNIGAGGPNASSAYLHAGPIVIAQQSGWGRFASHQGTYYMSGGTMPQVAAGCSGTCLQGFMYGYGNYPQVNSKRLVKEVAQIRIGPNTGAGVIKLCQYGSVIGSSDDWQGTTYTTLSGNLALCGGNNPAIQAGDQMRLYWYGPGITPTDYASIYSRGNALCTSLGFGSSKNAFYIIGDSISTDYLGYTPWWSFLKAKAGWDGRWMSWALSGGVFGGLNTANTVANKYSGSVVNILGFKPDPVVWTKGIMLILCGTNDIGTSNVAGATLLTNTIALSDTARAAGFKVVVMKLLPRSDSSWSFGAVSKETERGVYNNGLTTNASHFDAVLDPSLATGMSDPTNTTYWAADKLHPNSTGESSIADYIAANLNISTL